jgi:hypothetical protein
MYGRDERDAIEKLGMSIAYAEEAAARGLYMSLMQSLRNGIEAATEVGVHRSEGHWALVAQGLESARVALTRVNSLQFQVMAPALAERFRAMRERLAKYADGETMH